MRELSVLETVVVSGGRCSGEVRSDCPAGEVPDGCSGCIRQVEVVTVVAKRKTGDTYEDAVGTTYMHVNRIDVVAFFGIGTGLISTGNGDNNSKETPNPGRRRVLGRLQKYFAGLGVAAYLLLPETFSIELGDGDEFSPIGMGYPGSRY